MNLIYLLINFLLITTNVTNARSIKSKEFGLLGNDTKTWAPTPIAEEIVIINACDICKLTQYQIQNEMINQIDSLRNICLKLPEKNQDSCMITIEKSIPTIVEYLSERDICKDLNICEDTNTFKRIFYLFI